ncbi:putative Ig domain-containing protein, partial [Porticoccaceae bacterium]|nr:putative Ig domain-containing protein [Porticoccaceae bacterium]
MYRAKFFVRWFLLLLALTACKSENNTSNQNTQNDRPKLVLNTCKNSNIIENNQFTCQVLAEDLDPNTTLKYRLNMSPVGMTIDLNGKISWTPGDSVSSGQRVIEVEVDDRSGTGNATDIKTFTLNVTAINDGPKGEIKVIYDNKTGKASQGDKVTTDVDELFDPEGLMGVEYKYQWFRQKTNNEGIDEKIGANDITYQVTNADVGHQLFVEVSYKDNAGFDNKARSSTTSQVININDPPVVNLTTCKEHTAIEDDQFTCQVLADDVDLNTTLTYRLSRSPPHMTIDAEGKISWIPGDSVSAGIETIEVQVHDAIAIVTEKFILNVIAKNDPPVLSVDKCTNHEAIENKKFACHVSAEDLDSHTTLTYRLNRSPKGMSIDKDTGYISWIPGDSVSDGIEIVEVEVDDQSNADNAIDTMTFTLKVKAKNDQPVLNLKNCINDSTAIENIEYSCHVQAFDLDPDTTLAYRLNKSPESMTIDVGGKISWTPGDTVSDGIETIEVQVHDAITIVTEEFILNVKAVNDAPEFILLGCEGKTATEDEEFSCQVSAEDPDPTYTFTYGFIQSPKDMIIDAEGKIRWTPPNSVSNDPVKVNVVVNDGSGADNATDTSTFTLDVNATNDSPVLNLKGCEGKTAIEDVEFSCQVSAEDPDQNQTFTYRLTQYLGGMNINENTGDISWTPPNSVSNDPVNVKVEVNDQSGASDTGTFTLNVQAVNDAPELILLGCEGKTATEDKEFSCQVLADDPDPTYTFTYGFIQSPKDMIIDAEGKIRWTPPNSVSNDPVK